MKWQAFLHEILGDAGFQAVQKTSEVMAPVVVPRSILGWVQLISEKGYQGRVPGVEGSYMSLAKTEDGYSGAVVVNDNLMTFEKASTFHVAATIGQSLEIDFPEIPEKLKKKNLTELGKAIDLLIKTQAVQLHKAQAKPAGPPAPQNPPVPPSAASRNETPIALGQGQAERVKEEVSKLGRSEQSESSGQKLRVYKSETEKTCQICKKKNFSKGQFEGCDCLKELSKHIKTEINNGDSILVFDRVLSSEALEALIVLLKD